MPDSAAGWRMEPPVSVPSAQGALPAATAAALPPLEPPGTRARSQGLSTGPYAEFSVDEPIANSSWLSLPRIGEPARPRRSTTVAVYGGRNPSRIFEPAWLGMSFVQKRSLTPSGTPASGAPDAAPWAGDSAATHSHALSSSAAARSR